MGTLPTVKIKADSKRGWKIINASDFDDEKHKLFDKDEVLTVATEAPAKAPDKIPAKTIDQMSKDELKDLVNEKGLDVDLRMSEDAIRKAVKAAT